MLSSFHLRPSDNFFLACLFYIHHVYHKKANNVTLSLTETFVNEKGFRTGVHLYFL
ncbi:hypothetical protein GCM10023310_44740 [Paenibacillus vulneris]